MKQFFAFLLMVAAFAASGQTPTKEPKIRVTPRFFTTVYEIGDKDVNEKTLKLHLERTAPEAYYQFRRGDNLGWQSVVFAVVGLGGSAVGAFAEKSETKIAGYLVASVSFLTSAGLILASGRKKEKAIDTYNRKFGY